MVSVYVLEDNLRLTEMFVIGCILLLFALLFNFRKPIIKKTAYAVLVLYTIFFDVCGIMLIGVASPVIWIAWVYILFNRFKFGTNIASLLIDTNDNTFGFVHDNTCHQFNALKSTGKNL